MNTLYIVGGGITIIFIIILLFLIFKKKTPTTTKSTPTTKITDTSTNNVTQSVNCTGNFSPWSTCDKTCGGGIMKRTYSITNNGTNCPYTNNYIDTSSCNTQPCPVDCQVSEWSSWSNCPSCGSGTKSRTRNVITQPQNGGALCPALIDTSSCNAPPCPTDCQTSIWSPWSTCNKTCGGGTQTRTRTILSNPSNGGQACPTLQEDVSCNIQPCSVDCTVSDWSLWSSCSNPCGGGTQTRTRNIINNSSYGGLPCPVLQETIPCNTQACPMTYTSSVEIGSNRDTSFNITCPSGSYINQIYGRYGMWNDAIGVKCSNGYDSGQFGGTTGGPYITNCSTGFTGVSLSLATYDNEYVGIIKPKCNNTETVIGANSRIIENKSLVCPTGSVLGAVYGDAGQYLNKVGFKCVPKS